MIEFESLGMFVVSICVIVVVCVLIFTPSAPPDLTRKSYPIISENELDIRRMNQAANNKEAAFVYEDGDSELVQYAINHQVEDTSPLLSIPARFIYRHLGEILFLSVALFVFLLIRHNSEVDHSRIFQEMGDHIWNSPKTFQGGIKTYTGGMYSNEHPYKGRNI